LLIGAGAAAVAASIPGVLVAQGKPVVVFAAASLKQAVEALAGGKPPFVVSAGASGALARQIEAGAPAEVFASADPKWVDDLEKKGLLVAGTRRVLAGNTLVVIAPKNSKTRNISLKNLPKLLTGDARWVTADPVAAPLGQYTKEAFEAAGIYGAVQPRAAVAADAAAAVAMVARGGLAFGVVYATDAKLTKDVRVIAKIPADTHHAILYEIALVKGARPEAKLVLDRLTGSAGRASLKKYGFLPLSAST
jgi:molybdate transport system substrate-binding protein